MFDLLSNVDSVPIEQDALTSVQRGMNKVRVSVGDHISEPAEVFIVTGKSGQNLETYIIFYMLEPRIRVVYACDQNPYPHSSGEDVSQEAIAFVEEMGSILEEIPWDTMSEDQKASWIEKEILYSEPVDDEVEDLREIEELEVVQEEVDDGEAVEGGDAESVDDGGVVEVTDEEFQEALLDDEQDGGTPDSDEEGPEEEEDVEETEEGDEDETYETEDGLEDVVVAEGDFDELLKQAFLKPDVVEKTRRGVRRGRGVQSGEEAKDEDAGGQGEPLEESQDVPGSAGDREDVPEEMADDAGPSTRRDGSRFEAAAAASAPEPAPDEDYASFSQRETRLKVIRFLSRF